jgi:cytochrome c biogenesis protein CcmG, thiol:disulfide interchange protein DsbE
MSEGPSAPKARPSGWAYLPLLALLAVVLAAVFVLSNGQEREKLADPAGRAAPPMALAQLNTNGQVNTASFRGRPYLINAFASWCVPCRAEHPVLMQLQAQGVAILGLAYKDEPAQTTQFLNDLGNPFQAVGIDGDGQYSLDLGTTGVPETFVVDSNGTIVLAFRQPLTIEAMNTVILPALREAGFTPPPEQPG